MSTETKEKQNAFSKIINLLGASNGWYAMPSEVRKKKRHLRKCASDLTDYLYEWFCRTKKDAGFFHLEALVKENEYSENSIREALRQINKANILLVKDLGNKNFAVLTVKESNKIFLEKLEAGEIAISNILFTEEPGTLKRISNLVKNFVLPAQKNDSSAQSTELKNQPVELKNNVTEHLNQGNDFISEGESIVNNTFSELVKQSLDLNLLDPFIIDHHHIEGKSDDEKIKNKNSEEGNLREKILTSINSNPINIEATYAEDSVLSFDGEESFSGELALVQEVDSPAPLSEEKKFIWDESCDKLYTAFENLKNKAGKPANFNLIFAEKYIKTKDHAFLWEELEAYPLRVDRDGLPVNAGYLQTLIEAGKSNKPQAYTNKIQVEKTKELETNYAKILNIFIPGASPSAYLPIIKKQICDVIRALIASKKFNDLINKINELKSLCDLKDFISPEVLGMVNNVIKEPVLI